jgi:hypothetical protein
MEKERNRLSAESIRGILSVQYNFRNVSCEHLFPALEEIWFN